MEQAQPVGIKLGDMAPDFALPMHPQGEFRLADERGQRALVLYFYPKDDTPGCTKQACAFRDLAAQFAAHGALILGVSKDSLAAHGRFAAKYALPFPLLSDAGGALRQRFGNPQAGGELIRRITYVIDKQGVVRHIVNGDGQAKVPEHIEQALRVAAELAAE